MTLETLAVYAAIAALVYVLLLGCNEAHKRGQQRVQDEERVRQVLEGKDLEQ